MFHRRLIEIVRHLAKEWLGFRTILRSDRTVFEAEMVTAFDTAKKLSDFIGMIVRLTFVMCSSHIAIPNVTPLRFGCLQHWCITRRFDYGLFQLANKPHRVRLFYVGHHGCDANLVKGGCSCYEPIFKL